jgi:hypothetical protein
MNKIFGIGLNKTGTTSLNEAVKLMGFKSVHWQCKKGNIKLLIEKNNANEQALLQGIDDHDAFFDWNHPRTNHLFKILDEQNPNSKFILHTRDMDDWINSRYQHVRSIPDLEKWQRRYPDNPWYNLDVDAWKKEYQNHHKAVKKYFKDRPEDLLIFNVFEGDGWERLCDFLNQPVPSKSFPKKNEKTNRKAWLNRIKKAFRY